MSALKRIARILGYIFGFTLSIALLYWLYTIVKIWIILAVVAGAVAVFFPLMIRHGVKTVFKERDAVYAQLAHNMPVKYNKGRIFRGFAEILLLLWLIVPPIMLIPGGMYVAVLPVITVVIFVVEGLAANVWADIGWSKALYWLMNIGIYIAGIALGLMLNIVLR